MEWGQSVLLLHIIVMLTLASSTLCASSSLIFPKCLADSERAQSEAGAMERGTAWPEDWGTFYAEAEMGID